MAGPKPPLPGACHQGCEELRDLSHGVWEGLQMQGQAEGRDRQAQGESWALRLPGARLQLLHVVHGEPAHTPQHRALLPDRIFEYHEIENFSLEKAPVKESKHAVSKQARWINHV